MRKCFFRLMTVLCIVFHSSWIGAEDIGKGVLATPEADDPLAAIVEGFVGQVTDHNYRMQEGYFYLLDVEDCFERHAFCVGNNPRSPYALAFFPTDGLQSERLKLAPTDALVLIGRTPPVSRYFGFTHYVLTRASRRIPWLPDPIFGSIADTLNMERIGYEPPQGTLDALAVERDPFSKLFAIVMTPNRRVADAISGLLVGADLSAQAINVMEVPSVPGNTDYDPLIVGYGRDADTFTLMLRATPTGVPDEIQALEGYMEALPIHLWRIGVDGQDFEAYEWTPYKSRLTEEHEIDKLPDAEEQMNALVAKIQERHPDQRAQISSSPLHHSPNGIDCIQDYRFCAGDTQDGLYFFELSGLRRMGPSNSWYVVDVNHRKTGKGTYTNHSVYRLDLIAGIVDAYDEYCAGSAKYYADGALNGAADYENFCIFRFARNCEDEERDLGYCIEVPYPTADDPVGAEDRHQLTLFGRIYLNKETGVGPAFEEIVPPRVILY